MDLTYLKPPEEGSINVVALVANTASAALDLFSGTAPSVQRQLVTFICNVDIYITFSKVDDATITAPVITDTSGDSRTWGPIPAGTPWSRMVGARNRYCKVISEYAGYLRWRVED